MSGLKRNYTVGEEIFSAVSHGVGAALSVAALVTLLWRATVGGDIYSILSAAIFGGSLVLLYTMSTLYHALVPARAKHVFRIFDHVTIFVLIAGTYTPYLLVCLRPVDAAAAWILFFVLWGLTLLGAVFDSIMLDKFHKIEMVLFVAMGWCILIRANVLAAALAPAGLVLLFIGGVCYTVGILFFAMYKIPYMHSVWHLFVLAGSILHYFSVCFYVL